MTAEERFERIEANLERLAMLATSTAASVIAHDEQIDKLVKVAQTQQQQWESLKQQWESLRGELAQLHREFQAYLTTIHPRQ
jgi:cell division protein FtsB